jgi:hypothetical protein
MTIPVFIFTLASSGVMAIITTTAAAAAPVSGPPLPRRGVGRRVLVGRGGRMVLAAADKVVYLLGHKEKGHDKHLLVYIGGFDNDDESVKTGAAFTPPSTHTPNTHNHNNTAAAATATATATANNPRIRA